MNDNPEICNYLKNLHRTNRDERIILHEEENRHEYEVDGKCDYLSVSSLTKRYFDVFDSKKVLNDMKETKAWIANTHKYSHLNDEEILKIWNQTAKAAIDAGTTLHKHIEIFYNRFAQNNFQTEPSFFEFFPSTPEYKQFQTFHTEIMETLATYFNIKVYRTEMRVFDEESKMAGTIDMLLSRNDGESYYLLDWKNVKDRHLGAHKPRKFQSMAKAPLNHLKANDLNKYGANLSCYRYFLEKNNGIKILKNLLILFHPTFKERYYIIEVPYLKKEVELMLEERKKELVVKIS